MAKKEKMALTKQLAKFSEYMNDYIYTCNNMFKYDSTLGGYLNDFANLTIEDIIIDIPQDIAISCKFVGTNDNKYIIELNSNEYSVFRSEHEIRIDVGLRFASILTEVQRLLTGDKIKVDYSKLTEAIYRDNYAVNGKVRTVYMEIYEIDFM